MTDPLVQVNEFLDWVFSYGSVWIYLAIFLACHIENLFPPFPGDTFIVAAGGMVGLARLDLALAVFVIILGGTSSVMLLYHFGDRYGRKYFIRKNFKYFSADDIHNMERQFQKWGSVLMVVSRFVVGFRSALAIVAGISEYNQAKMVMYTIVSYMLFTGVVFYISITLVDNLDKIEYYFRTYSTIVWPVLVLLVGLYVGRIIYSHVRRG